MAGGSSSVGFLRNEVVLGKMWSRSVVVESVRVRNVVKVVALPVLCRKNRRVVVANVSKSNPLGESQSGVSSVSVSKEGGNSDSGSVVGKDIRILETGFEVKADIDGSGGGDVLGGSGNGSFSSGGGGGGGGDGGDDKEEDEFGPILKFEEVMKETEARGVSLPSDMLEAAKSVGIRKLLLLRYLDLQIVIDSCCATFAEVQKRGKDFWAEFELYVADLLVGVVVNVALVGMLAPYARFGGPSVSKGFLGRMQHAYGALPSSVFEAERPGCRFTVKQRIGTYFYKGILYGIVGFGCGIIGQGIANLIMTAKRSIKKSEDDIPVPPLLKSAALWGVFLAVSSNTRYQIINGLERLVETSPIAKQVPPVAMAFTVGVRFANNVYGGMQFVDWARWSGVQ
ncbi:protein RETICULATA, chloroplastic isoform X2 [Quercus lobata]|uniref:protein RETICULATA, chloroplastic isoform X2 n=1 Tax=Quercus lobata TaxID=97700 RepID=UPI00124794C2|nr:protein RETICULATA, chloroplastic isoform X2 [Quercus lobata]